MRRSCRSGRASLAAPRNVDIFSMYFTRGPVISVLSRNAGGSMRCLDWCLCWYRWLCHSIVRWLCRCLPTIGRALKQWYWQSRCSSRSRSSSWTIGTEHVPDSTSIKLGLITSEAVCCLCCGQRFLIPWTTSACRSFPDLYELIRIWRLCCFVGVARSVRITVIWRIGLCPTTFPLVGPTASKKRRYRQASAWEVLTEFRRQ